MYPGASPQQDRYIPELRVTDVKELAGLTNSDYRLQHFVLTVWHSGTRRACVTVRSVYGGTTKLRGPDPLCGCPSAKITAHAV